MREEERRNSDIRMSVEEGEPSSSKTITAAVKEFTKVERDFE